MSLSRTLQVNYKLLPFLTKPQPIKVAVGGRGSGKSIGIADMAVCRMEREAIDVYCLREFQETIADSIHRTMQRSITDRLDLPGWDVQENKIVAPNGARTTYKGASRNTNSIQGAEDYRLSVFSEAHTASQDSLDKLLPTILRKPGAQCWFEANPQSSEDPFSQRFISPYLDHLERDGFYEDELHYIVVVNWRDNPWWNEEQERLRAWDYENLSRAKYDWIWEGKFNDSVENSLIMPEWFDACVDAHEKLGIKPQGAKVAAHDPSDEGSDSKGFALRHGIVVTDVEEKASGNINEGGDWATGLAIQHGADSFTWDCDGMGVGLSRQVSTAFKGKMTQVSMFKGSEGPDNPDAIYEPLPGSPIQNTKTWSEVARNKRAQYYLKLRDRCYKTFRAVIHGEYHNPDDLISFASSISNIRKLRSELCRMPVKPNGSGRFELYTKPEMKTKFKLPSPNMGDSVMMLMREPAVLTAAPVMPRPIRPSGRR
ncbi:hypothetical protein A3724_16605 [Alcanivorax sp. HI0033]|uniref:PBSX family phage terminase large subunit n=1 Tax=unclassified Alcanivorax TaxID=2638842 RepID=UPI0007B94A02|nr:MULTISPECIES: PBSX family phage terminase large subunit [unclassified Alcanivorax]KZX78116.1 hypothetical protein A3717_11605 [Alcanivorax sp. HI0013]KZX81824.1 hypothetical protein A3716_17105 [Alcanivorax sp. HI0011]KZY14089.1 hypothetical protein A3725_01460 [Alcanivorax sp. HI0035]KZX61294.1 hypothetical protein A3713_10005 [Alcanivorax sp. HI0003]KZX65736.1 hypothetical protein A3714_15005 [Alcanivorax sp. HI0007]